MKERVDELHEVQPDAGPPRLPFAAGLSRNRRHAGAAIIEAAIEVQKKGKKVLPGDHDPARRHRRGTEPLLKKRAIDVAEECMKKSRREGRVS